MTFVTEDGHKIRVRVSAPDPYAGLTSHDYIRKRNLSPWSVRQQHHECAKCKQDEDLPAVLNILESFAA